MIPRKFFAPPLALAAALVAALIYAGCETFLLSGSMGFPLDDSWIHLRFARNLAEGEGLTYNPGQWVTGSTAPLWTSLLALGFLLPGAGFLVWAKLLGLLSFLSTVWATMALGRELGGGAFVRGMAGALVATTHWLVWSALSGMEIQLFSALALWGLVWHLRERRQAQDRAEPRDWALPRSALLLAAACLARPEGLLLLALALADRFFVRPAGAYSEGGGHPRDAEPTQAEPTQAEPGVEPQALALRLAPGTSGFLAVAAVLLSPVLFFYWKVGGSPLPTTFGAKAQPDADLLPSLRYLRLVIDVFFRSQPITTLLAAGGMLALLARPTGGRWIPAAWVVGQSLFYSMLASESGPLPLGNFGRYYFPLLPVIIVLGLLGLQPFFERSRGGLRLGPLRMPTRVLIVALLLIPQAFGLAGGMLTYARTVSNVQDSDVRAAFWLRERLSAEALVGVQDAGALAFFLPNQVMDLAGIVNPDIRPALLGTSDDPRYAPEVYWEERLARYLAGPRPDYLVLFSSSYPVLSSGQAPGFTEVMSFTVEDNLAMAGDELLVLSTPWTRFPLTPPPSTATP